VSARVCIVTSGHLATCPRMLKAADALAGAGYGVRVVSARYMPWAAAADRDLAATRPWAWTVVDYDRQSAPRTYLRTGARARLARALCRAIGPARAPLGLAARAASRVHPELVRAATAEPADLIYGGTSGALAAAAEAARRRRVPYALDLEDFHSAEQTDASARILDRLNGRIERGVLAGAAFLTVSSAAIAAAYQRTYGLDPIVVHNTFPLPARPPDAAPTSGDRLRLYWFSQTIGPGRGLEDAVQAMGIAGLPGELHLRGLPADGYLDALAALQQRVAPQLRIVHHPPAAPDQMIELSRPYDVGLVLEAPLSRNRELCLANKALVYPLAGLAVALTDTPGHRPLAADLGAGALVYRSGDVQALADGLARWAADKALLARGRSAAWQAARRRWHWEDPAERGALLAAVAGAVA